ncbi:MAG: hypothetical protein K8R86_10015 [Bacteroidales bacterium]|nr:hypothetical protein [Bacteroidales bacterium]
MNQQEEEILILDYFRKNYDDFPKGKVIKSESPDFILKESRKRIIGIELTRLDVNASTLKEKIEHTLKNKSQKFGIYQSKNFNEIWLIIHTDFIEKTKTYNITNMISKWKFSFPFDRVFLFDLFEKRIYGLK